MAFSYDESENPDKKRIFSDFDLAVNKGEYVAIIGHNGSGKYTLAKLLCGILQPTEGDILIDGMSVKDENNYYKIKEKCGMIFQNPDNQIVASIVEE
ncbi:MAG: ATP-binding cassette domain-containing protein, partial [Clostridia bacterium]|nr:ATP-binding cassette domain-containing protein [Clostridia bacterium]